MFSWENGKKLEMIEKWENKKYFNFPSWVLRVCLGIAYFAKSIADEGKS